MRIRIHYFRYSNPLRLGCRCLNRLGPSNCCQQWSLLVCIDDLLGCVETPKVQDDRRGEGVDDRWEFSVNLHYVPERYLLLLECATN
jgi:hypothetical protein